MEPRWISAQVRPYRLERHVVAGQFYGYAVNDVPAWRNPAGRDVVRRHHEFQQKREVQDEEESGKQRFRTFVHIVLRRDSGAGGLNFIMPRKRLAALLT